MMRKRARARFCIFGVPAWMLVRLMKQQKRKKAKGDMEKNGRSGLNKKKVSSRTAEEIVEKARAVAEPLCDSTGIELVYVEYQRESKGNILRVFIDKPGGIKLDDCTHVSRQLSDILDVYFETDAPYSLEVSSPGISRPLGKKMDFQRFKGEVATVRTRQPFNGKTKFKGTLMGISGDSVKLMVSEDVIVIPYKNIKKAGLVNYNGDSR